MLLGRQVGVNQMNRRGRGNENKVGKGLGWKQKPIIVYAKEGSNQTDELENQ